MKKRVKEENSSRVLPPRKSFRLFKNHQHLVGFDRVAFFDLYVFDHAVSRSVDGDFHFHGIHNDDFILFFNLIADMDDNADDFSGHGRFDFRAHFCESPYLVLLDLSHLLAKIFFLSCWKLIPKLQNKVNTFITFSSRYFFSNSQDKTIILLNFNAISFMTLPIYTMEGKDCLI